MRFCYVDESGTGSEPIATMVGIIVDSHRMHITKGHWSELLSNLSDIIGKDFAELHTCNFYSGSGIWRQMTGRQRAAVISAVFTWIAVRKHHVVYSAVIKSQYREMKEAGNIPPELNTIWRYLGYHIILGVQKRYQKESSNKGNTIFIFDNEERERMRFTNLIMNPPAWSDGYYKKNEKNERLDQIIDVPYFGDSKEVSLIQVADFLCFFLRRFAEIKENLIGPKYPDESTKIEAWIKALGNRSIGRSMMYPSRRKCDTAELYWSLAPNCIRTL